MQPNTEFINVTPRMAQDWLAFNKSNRRISLPVVEAYANDMRAGAWRLTHQGIGFADDGTLIDGQHRLHAIVKAGFPVMLAVTRGLSSAAQEVVDAQKPRSVSDQLSLIDGLPSANKYAGACRVIAEIDKGRQLDKYTLNDIRVILGKHKQDIADIRKQMHGTEFDSVVVVGPLAYALAADRAKVLELTTQISRGEGLKRTDAGYQIREHVLRNGCRDRRAVIGVMLRGAYAHLHGEKIDHLKVAFLADLTSPLMRKVVEFFRLANRT